jgi:hypothetical protein
MTDKSPDERYPTVDPNQCLKPPRVLGNDAFLVTEGNFTTASSTQTSKVVGGSSEYSLRPCTIVPIVSEQWESWSLVAELVK